MHCVGYRLHLPRIGKFDPERAKAAGIPLKAWGLLQKQETVEMDGVTYYQSQVLGAPRRGLTVTYCTDTRPVPEIMKYADDADLLILEGMYGEPEKLGKAIETKHMMFTEAAEIARDCNAHRLWLTHFSPSLPNPKDYLPLAQEIFPDTVIPEDGRQIDLMFTDGV